MKITPSAIRNALRKLWLYSDQRSEAIKNAKTGIGYLCQGCKKLVARKETNVDHIVEVGSYKNGWDGLIDRMFVDASGLQVLCKKCHKVKR